MSFTDEDLKRLKDDLAKMPNIDVCNYFEADLEILALIARLEAAEKALESSEKSETGRINAADWNEWRKAAGK